MNEQDDVGILLDGTRLPQVAHDRLLVVALLDLARQLRQGNHRHIQFLGQRLERSGNFGHLGGAVLTTRSGATHQLQVINHHQTQLTVLTRQPSGTRTQFKWIQCRRFIDEKICVLHFLDRIGQARPVIFSETPGAQALLVDTTHRTDQTHGQLSRTHLHREHRNRHALVNGHMLGHIQCKRGLTHRGAGRNDDEVAGLHARGHTVKVCKTRRHTGDVVWILAVVQVIDPLDHLRQHRLKILKTRATPRPVFGDLKDSCLGLVENLPGIAPLWIERGGGDFIRDGNQATQDRPVAHDLRVAAHIRRRGCATGQRIEVSQATRVFELAGGLERVMQGQHISRLIALHQPGQMLPDQPMVIPIEIVFAQHIANPLPGGVVEQHRTQH